MLFVYLVLLAKLNAISFVFGKQGYGPGEQDYGYIDIFDGAHMFYWLFYTMADVKNYTERPLVLWLQGGPSSTGSGQANFNYVGPLDMDGKEREYPWAKYVNLLLIDNPLGAGYSYVDDIEHLSRNNTEIAINLVKTMQGFYKNHPEFLAVPLHVFGESYAGKMGIEFVWEMWKASKANATALGKLESFITINPFISTKDLLNALPKVAYEMGIMSEDESAKLAKDFNDTINLMHEGLWSKAAMHTFEKIKESCKNLHGIQLFNVLNIAKTSDDGECGVEFGSPDLSLTFKMNFAVKIALRVPLLVFWNAQRLPLLAALSEDILKPVSHIVEQVLNDTDVDVRLVKFQQCYNMNILLSFCIFKTVVKKKNKIQDVNTSK